MPRGKSKSRIAPINIRGKKTYIKPSPYGLISPVHPGIRAITPEGLSKLSKQAIVITPRQAVLSIEGIKNPMIFGDKEMMELYAPLLKKGMSGAEAFKEMEAGAWKKFERNLRERVEALIRSRSVGFPKTLSNTPSSRPFLPFP